MSNVTPESTKKLYCFWSDHTSFSTILYDFAHNPTPKQTAHRVATFVASRTSKKLDDGWPESEKGKDVDVKYIEERRRCEKISEERMNI